MQSLFFPLAGFIELFFMIRFKAQPDSAKIILQLLQCARPDDWAGYQGIAEQPGQGNL